MNRAIVRLAAAAAVLLAASPAVADPPAQTPALLEAGKAAYAVNCSVCHGDRGAGDGVAAASLNPKPRHLGSEPFKNGLKPEQVFASISQGLPGTVMAPFGHLPEGDRWALAYFVLSLRTDAAVKK